MRNDSQKTSPAKGLGILAAAALACTLAAHGCTTNQMPGNGTPARSGPAYGPTSPTSTPGTSGGNAPMMSSYVGAAMVTADVPAMTPFVHQVHYLGPADPAPSPQSAPTLVTGQVAPASNYPNAIATINASISSQANGGISSGAATTDGGVTVAPATLTTPTTSASALTPGAYAAGPSVTSALNSSPTVAANSGTSVLTPTASSALTTSPTAASATPAADVPMMSAASNSSTAVSAPVTITQSNGRVRAVTAPTTAANARIRSLRAASTTTTSSSRVRAVRTTGGILVTNQ